MAFISTPRDARQAENLTCNNTRELTPPGSWTVFIVASIAACALLLSAGAQNVAHGYSLGVASSEFRALVLATASAGASILGPFCWLAVARGRGFGTRVAALLLGLGCLTYASVCSLGFVAGSRDKATSEQVIAADTYADKRAVAAAARAELATLKGQSTRVVKRRKELMGILAAPSTVTKGAAPVHADAQAAALAFYARAAGVQVAEGAVSVWLSLGTTLFLELAAALGLTVAASLRPTPRRQQQQQVEPAPTVHERAVEERKNDNDSEDPPTPPPVRQRGKGGRPRDVTPAAAVERLKQAGGKANGSLASIAKLVGSRSKTSCHRLLGELAAAGSIRLTTSPAGCSVALA